MKNSSLQKFACVNKVTAKPPLKLCPLLIICFGHLYLTEAEVPKTPIRGSVEECDKK